MWVRTASNRDIADISTLLGVVWHHTYDNIYGSRKVAQITRQWHNTAELEKLLKQPASEFLVADDGNQITGMAFARMTGDTTAKLVQLYVLPQFHGKGVGKMLLEEIEESFFEARQFTLEVEEKNIHAIDFYEKHGFTRTGTTQNCGKDNSGIRALILTKVR